jgi:hypothetical protein
MDEDYSHLSDEELQRLYNEHETKNAHPSPSADPSQLSDEELKRQYNNFEGGLSFGTEEPTAPQPQTDQGFAGDIAAGLRGIRSAIPFARDVGSAIYSLGTGRSVSEEIARQQAQDEALQKEHPKSYFGGEVAGTFMPLGVVGGPSLARIAARGEEAIAKQLGSKIGQKAANLVAPAAVGSTWGAAQGFGEGKDLESRMENAKTGAVFGGLFGAATPVVAKALGLTAPTAAEEAAGRLKTSIRSHVDPNYNISIPSSVSSEGLLPRTATDIVSTLPFSKNLIERGVERGKSQLAEAVEKIPGISATGANRYTAGSDAKSALLNWITQRSGPEAAAYYKNLDTMFAPHANKPIDFKELTNRAIDIDRVLASTGVKGRSAATSAVENAITGKTPKGYLNYQDAMNLRSRIGQLSGDFSAVPSIERKEYKNLYEALTRDLENHFEKYGGPSAKNAYTTAIANADRIISQKEALESIIGKGAKGAPEAIFNKLAAYAKAGGKENIDLLKKAMNLLPPTGKDELRSAIIKDFGDHNGEFLINDFVKHFGNMTAEGKNVIFGPKGNITREALEDINTISKKYIENGKAKNLTNRMAMIAAAAGAIPILSGKVDLTTEVGGIALAAPVIATILSKPRLASMASKFLKMPDGEFNAVMQAEMRKHLTPKGSVTYSPVAAEDDREQRASGGKVGKRDYPAKKLSRMEKAVARAQKAIAEETKPLMEMPDAHIAHALEIAKDK